VRVGVGRLRVWRIDCCWYGSMHKPTPVQPFFFFFFGLLGNNRQRVFGTDRHIHRRILSERFFLPSQDLFGKAQSGLGLAFGRLENLD
jgi:hypothetical protein